MFNKRFSTHRVRIPTNIECELRTMLDRLFADDDDSLSLQNTIRPYFVSERPLVLILRGATTCLYVEGPWYTVGDKRFPLGAQLLTEFGWFDLSPVQAAGLIQLDNEAFDATAIRWLTQNGLLSTGQPARNDRNRVVDDPLALRQMADAASRSPTGNGRTS
jgi:hypothetical protein